MNESRLCPVCNQVIVGRSDKKHCSVECKKVSKKQYDQARYLELAPQIIEKVRKYSQANKSAKQLYDRAYRAKHSERIKKTKRNYEIRFRLEHPEIAALNRIVIASNRRAKLKGKITRKDLIRLLNRFGYRCAYCNECIKDLYEFDHVIPISRGGSNTIGNILPTCQKCNRSKSYKFLMEYRLNKFVPRNTRRET